MREFNRLRLLQTQNKPNDKNSAPPPPPQLLTPNVINLWKQNTQQTSCSSSKSSLSNPPSPSLPSVKRKKSNPCRIPQKENFDSTDTNSNQVSSLFILLNLFCLKEYMVVFFYEGLFRS